MAISLDSYLSSGGGGAVSSFTPTGDYVHGITTSGAVTIGITAPAGKKIVFTHFRGVEWGTADNRLNLNMRTSNSYVNSHKITSLDIDSVDVMGLIVGLSDVMGMMQRGYSGSSISDPSYSHPFVGFKMSTFNATFAITNGFAVAYTYYIADE